MITISSVRLVYTESLPEFWPVCSCIANCQQKPGIFDTQEKGQAAILLPLISSKLLKSYS